MGVRYNAEKKKVGNYYSTPIWSFRCKCHLCDGWFEIQTDPKNTRYVVVSGARQKDEEWNPEENGGFAIHDTDKAAIPVDPLAALEKTTDAKNLVERVQKPRIESLQELSEQYNADPYTLSARVRKRFREEKKIQREKQDADDELKGRYGLPETLGLVADDEASRKIAKEEWEKGQRELELRQQQLNKRRKLGVEEIGLSLSRSSRRTSRSSGTSSEGSLGKRNDAVSALRARLLGNTSRQSLASATLSRSQIRSKGTDPAGLQK
ncbi:hypothetical protein AX16_001928 [Volvariella volvacea WC 439]|nr:hypothetical protein AX16_001928 [Volvariella volvacea WC 439]